MKKKRLVDKIATFLLVLAGVLTCLILLIILAYIFWKGAPIAFRPSFIFTWPRGIRMEGGIFPTIITSLYLTALSTLIVTPIGIGAAIYLAEYTKENWLVRLIRFGGDSLASVPSIVFGLFGLALFVYILGLGWSMISGALTLALMILPIIMRTTEEALLAVPRGYQLGSFGLGATRWQTIRRVVLPAAMPRILTGIILGVSRAFGEAAAVIFTAGLAINAPLLPTEAGRTMTNHLYLLAVEGINIKAAFGTAVLLVLVILVFNTLARYLIKRI